jgi:CheY-like chemotaxis protein
LRILLIDDASDVHEEFSGELDTTKIEIVSVYSRDEAIARLHEDFDLIVCDLKLPSDSTGGEPEVVHGLAVCDAARAQRPGVPVVILSAFGDLSDLEDRLAEAPREAFLGGERTPLLRHKIKLRIDQVIDLVSEHSENLQNLHSNIEVAWGAGPPVYLTRYERQSLLIYAATRSGVLVRARGMLGGRSDAKTLWIQVEDRDGAVVGRGVAKIDILSRVESEESLFREHVALLPAGAFAGAVHVVKAGASNFGLIVYSLANEETLFQALKVEPLEAAGIVGRLFDATEPWHGSKAPRERTVRAIRQLLVTDDELEEIRAAHGDFMDFAVEDITVQIFECRSHGDLHGGNVHLRERSPMLIDFARIAMTPACLDPITLEISAVTHPDAQMDLGGWPAISQALVWPTATYLENCPITDFIEACRRWLDAVRRGDRDRDATLYAYSLRQLKYAEVDPALPIAFCQGAADRLTR